MEKYRFSTPLTIHFCLFILVLFVLFGPIPVLFYFVSGILLEDQNLQIISLYETNLILKKFIHLDHLFGSRQRCKIIVFIIIIILLLFYIYHFFHFFLSFASVLASLISSFLCCRIPSVPSFQVLLGLLLDFLYSILDSHTFLTGKSFILIR